MRPASDPRPSSPGLVLDERRVSTSGPFGARAGGRDVPGLRIPELERTRLQRGGGIARLRTIGRESATVPYPIGQRCSDHHGQSALAGAVRAPCPVDCCLGGGVGIRWTRSWTPRVPVVPALWYTVAMQNPISKQAQNLDSKELLQVFSSSWWQLDASHRDLVAKRREPIHHILAKLHNRDLEIRVVRRLEASDAHTDVGDEDRGQ